MILTNWGYSLPDLNSLDSLMTVATFNTLTASKYSTDGRVSDLLAEASQSVRDYVGWHLAPNAKCVLETTFFDRRVTKINGGVLIQLPARYVTGVTEVLIGGVAVTEYVLQPNGILLVNSVGSCNPYINVKVTYNAGLPSNLVGAVQNVMLNRVVKGLSASNGIQSETAGGVSISYSAGYMTDASGAGLTPTEKEALSAYRVQGVF